MTYQISRNGELYGPYSLADLQRYVASGNILLTDLARSEGLEEWIPVSQIIGNIPVPAATPVSAPAVSLPYYPDPPNLHWGLVLLFSLLSCGLFLQVWDIIQAAWMRRIQPSSKALIYYIAFIAAWVLGLVLRVTGAAGDVQGLVGIGILLNLGASVLLIIGRFSLKNSLEQHYTTNEPVGLYLSGVMTFFFGGLYFQYHLNNIMRLKQSQLTGMFQA